MALLQIRGLCREYRRGAETIAALADVDLQIEAGEMVALVGPSGSGKTTLMNAVGCLDKPDAGEVWVGDERVDLLPRRKLVAVRRERIGFIFQNFYLLPELSARDNVALPMLFARRADRRERGLAILMATHDRELALRADRIVTMRDGRLSPGQGSR